MPWTETYLWAALIAVIALVVGWVGGRAHQRSSYRAAERLLPLKEYYRGINYLLNERPDQAVDVFIKNFEVTQETIETHLALGGLFRRRGEMARAIKIHQHLLARPSLNRPQQEKVQLELARDYFAAGLYDRAQGLLQELIDLGGRHRRYALALLIQIHEQFKEWEACHQLGLQLLKAGDQSMLIRIPHYLCEIAESSIDTNSTSESKDLIKNALQYDKKCIRALMLKVQLLVSEQEFKEALRFIKRLLSVDHSVFFEMKAFIIQTFQSLEAEDEYPKFLLEILENTSNVDIVIAFAQWEGEQEGSEAAQIFMRTYVKYYPYWNVFSRLVSDYAAKQHEESWLTHLDEKIQSTGLVSAQYTCKQCGFFQYQRFWFCPSCRYWGQVERVAEPSPQAVIRNFNDV